MEKEFPNSEISNKNLHLFLFQLAGYNFNPITFEIIQRPSKFGGTWKQVQQSINKHQIRTLINTLEDRVK